MGFCLNPLVARLLGLQGDVDMQPHEMLPEICGDYRLPTVRADNPPRIVFLRDRQLLFAVPAAFAHMRVEVQVVPVLRDIVETLALRAAPTLLAAVMLLVVN